MGDATVGDLRGERREPLQPGWYPAGDGIYQQYYAGRGRGWVDRYVLEIEARDPFRPPRSTDNRDNTVLLALIAFFILMLAFGAIFAAIV